VKTEWKDKPLLEKVVSVSVIVISVAIIVLAVLQLFDLWYDAGYVYVPLSGINLLLQAYMQWKPNRKIAIFSIGAAVVVFLCTAAVYIIK
jgi:hypothetical protein